MRSGAAWLVTLVAALATQAAAAAPVVILLSLDGVRHDYPERTPLPAFERIAREGLRAGRLVSVFPSNTFPAHVSLATGTYPDRHGILDNRFFDRERGVFDMGSDASWIEAEPLWAAAERQGVAAATFFWVGSETDWRGVGASHRVAPFDSDVGEARKVAQILEWLALPEASRPGLILSWWHGADRAGHRYGPDDDRVTEALAGQDAHLGALLEALDARGAWAETTLLVVSDHGMTAVNEIVPVRAALEDAKIDARLVLGTSVAHVFVDDAASVAAAQAVLEALDSVRVFRRENLPEALRLRHPQRTGDLVLSTDAPRTFREGSGASRAWAGLAWLLDKQIGLHGYAPDSPDMGGIFFALGRGIETGARPETVRAIDVAATVAGLLGIEPPAQSEGTPIPGIGAPEASRTDY